MDKNAAARYVECPNCGKHLDWSRSYTQNGRRYCKCSGCRMVYEDSTGIFSPDVQAYLVSGGNQYSASDFEGAINAYDAAIERDATCYEAYWMRLLAKNGIRCERDNGYKPTCYRANGESIFDQSDYKRALEYAPEVLRAEYEQQAKEIERIREAIYKESQTAEKFDIFISFKHLDDNKVPTDDYKYAYALYNRLTSKKYKVFFSPETLKNYVGTEYEPHIFKALSTAKVFLLVCSKSDYVMSTWVKNEWMRYFGMMQDPKLYEQGLKRPDTFLLLYPNEVPTNLPSKIAKIQGLAINNPDFYSTFDEWLRKCFEKYPSEITIPRRSFADKKEFGVKKNLNNVLQIQRKDFVATKVDIDVSKQIVIVKDFLSRRNFDAAGAMCKGILEKNPDSSLAKLYLKYADEGIVNDNDFITGYSMRGNTVRWLSEILAQCKEEGAYTQIITLATDICDLAIGERNAQKMMEAFELIIQWAPDKTVKRITEKLFNLSRKVVQENIRNVGVAKAMFNCVLKTFTNEQAEAYAKANFDFANGLRDVGLFADAVEYYDRATDIVDDAEYYMQRFLCKNRMKRCSEYTVASAVNDDDMADILRTCDGDARRNMQDSLVKMAVTQVNLGNYGAAEKIFNYNIQFVPQEDKALNRRYLVPFADAFLSKGQFERAESYYRPMINIDDACAEAHWGLLKAKHKCRSDKELLFNNSDISLEEDFLKTSANISDGADENLDSASQYKYYSTLNSIKLRLNECAVEQEGFAALKEGNFALAKQKFGDLFNMEINKRHLALSAHPDSYWGMLLAINECKNDFELFEKRDKLPFSEIQKDPLCEKYINALNAVKAQRREVSDEQWDFGGKQPPISKQEYLDNVTSIMPNHLKVYECFVRADNRVKYVKKRAQELDELKNAADANIEKKEKARNRNIATLNSAKSALIALLTIVIVGGLGGGAYGALLFYTDMPGIEWFETLFGYMPFIFGICMGVMAFLGAAIGLIKHIRSRSIGKMIQKAIVGGLIGSILGVAAIGLIMASGWALVPSVVALVIGITAYFCNRYIRKIKYGILKADENFDRQKNTIKEDLERQQNRIKKETADNTESMDVEIILIANECGIDLFKEFPPEWHTVVKSIIGDHKYTGAQNSNFTFKGYESDEVSIEESDEAYECVECDEFWSEDELIKSDDDSDPKYYCPTCGAEVRLRQVLESEILK